MFRGPEKEYRFLKKQSAASWNELLVKVLFADRSHSFQKLRILSETLEREFSMPKPMTSRKPNLCTPDQSWVGLEGHHYDLDPCLREAKCS